MSGLSLKDKFIECLRKTDLKKINARVRKFPLT